MVSTVVVEIVLVLVLVLGITATAGTTTDVPKPTLDPPDVDVLELVIDDELDAAED